MTESLPRKPLSVSVATTARLHFGFLDPSGRGKHPFGSVGLSLDQPETRLTLTRTETTHVTGAESERAGRYLSEIAKSSGAAGSYALHVDSAIRSHAGLGSGTQLALAVGTALSALEGLGLSPLDIARRLGRGGRSGIGIATFEAGGAVLDEGPRNGELPALVARVPFPEAWRVLLIFDPDTKGLDGSSESAAFEALPDFPEAERDNLYERIFEVAMPALVAGDFAAFSAEIGYLQRRMGMYFGPLQGGPYTSLRVGTLLDWLRSEGVTGLGQSSWGPTGFAFAPTESAAQALLEAVRRRTGSTGLQLVLAKGRNEGATITVSAQNS